MNVRKIIFLLFFLLPLGLYAQESDNKDDSLVLALEPSVNDEQAVSELANIELAMPECDSLVTGGVLFIASFQIYEGYSEDFPLEDMIAVEQSHSPLQYTYYAFTDDLGSIMRLYNSSGTVVFSAYYDPYLGRFLSPDNYVQLPTSAQSFNRYSYCLNNPLKYVDPDGEFALFLPVIGAVIGGATNLIANWDNIDGFWQGVAAFGVGAGAGFATAASGGAGASIWTVGSIAAVGGAVTGSTNNIIAQTGYNFKGFNQVDWEQVGIGTVTGAATGFAGGMAGYGASNMDFLVNGINSPVLRSAIISPLAAGAGHVAGGTTANLLMGENIRNAFIKSFDGIAKDMAIGGAIGVASTIGMSYASGINPWNGNLIDGLTISSKDLYLENEVQRIKDGIRYEKYPHDATEFLNNPNNRGYLPQGIQYKEYVVPSPGIQGSGPQRILVGSDGSWYYTPDHYNTFLKFKP